MTAVPSIDHPRLCGWFYFSGSLAGKKIWLQVEPWTEICNKLVPVEDFGPGRQDRRFCHRKVFRIFRFFGFGLPLPGCLFEVASYLRGYLLTDLPRDRLPWGLVCPGTLGGAFSTAGVAVA